MTSFDHKFLLGFTLALAVGCARQTAGEQAQAAADRPAEKPAATEPAAPQAAALPYPAINLTAAGLSSLSIAAPPGAQLKSRAKDQCVMTAHDYSLKIQAVAHHDSAQLKTAITRLKTFKRFTRDDESGFIAEFDEPAGKRYQLVRYVNAGSKELRCETTIGRPPKSAEQAAEAFAVCGSLS